MNGDVYNPGASAGDECRLPVHLEIHEASPPVEHSDEDLSGFSGSNSVSIDNLIDPGGHKSTALSPHVEGRLYGQFEKAPHRQEAAHALGVHRSPSDHPSKYGIERAAYSDNARKRIDRPPALPIPANREPS